MPTKFKDETKKHCLYFISNILSITCYFIIEWNKTLAFITYLSWVDSSFFIRDLMRKPKIFENALPDRKKGYATIW